MDPGTKKRYRDRQLSLDPSIYCLGNIDGIPVVLTQLPVAMIGGPAAAVTATRMYDTFPSIKVLFNLGVCGGVPNYNLANEASSSTAYRRPHVEKGDVIVSYPIENNGPAFIHCAHDEIKHRVSPVA